MPTLNGLYAITDGSNRSLLADKVTQSLKAGVTLIQYRSKSRNMLTRHAEAILLRELCHHFGVPLIINDDIELAKRIGADGVHLGKNDVSFSAARTYLGRQSIIGISCYNQFDLAKLAQQQGADYVALGSMFASPTKPDAPQASIELLIKTKKQLTIPICCIGGITLDNATPLINAGADMIAVISALYTSDHIEKTTRDFTRLFTSNSR